MRRSSDLTDFSCLNGHRSSRTFTMTGMSMPLHGKVSPGLLISWHGMLPQVMAESSVCMDEKLHYLQTFGIGESNFGRNGLMKLSRPISNWCMWVLRPHILSLALLDTFFLYSSIRQNGLQSSCRHMIRPSTMVFRLRWCMPYPRECNCSKSLSE